MEADKRHLARILLFRDGGGVSKEIVIMRAEACISAEPWQKSVVEAGYIISDCPTMSFVPL